MFHPNDAEFVYLLWIMENVNWSNITWDVYGTYQTAIDDHYQHLKHQIRYQNSHKHDATPWLVDKCHVSIAHHTTIVSEGLTGVF